MRPHFNELSPEVQERLVLLVEEMAETIQVAGKILRHGWFSYHPVSKEQNKDLLEKELGDVMCAFNLMVEECDVSAEAVAEYAKEKRKKVFKYLHHQEFNDPSN